MKELLISLRNLPEFQAVMKELYEERPKVPKYHPSETRESEEATIRSIKHLSAQQEGFDLLWILLMGRRNDDAGN